MNPSRFALNRLLFPALAATLALPAVADDESPRPLPPAVARGMEKIRAADLMTHVKVLCDPDLEGREAGGAGARQAATYIARRFRKAGLRPGAGAQSFIQTFEITEGHRITSTLELEIGGRRLDNFTRGADYMPVHLPDRKAQFSGGIAFAGYGLKSETLRFDEFADLPLKGSAALVFSGTPWSGRAASWILRSERKGFGTLEDKARLAAGEGAGLLLVVDDPQRWAWGGGTSEGLQLPDPRLPLKSPIPIVHVTAKLAARMTKMTTQELRLIASDIGAERESRSRVLRGRKILLKAEITGAADIGKNVVAILPGRDPDYRGEAVVIGAHYDHLGETRQGTFLGANDNASGTAAVLEIAASFAAMPEPPRRTVIFAAFGAEEIGRLGSIHYVKNPAVPIDRTVLMINFDMIGRNEPDHAFAVGTTSSPELHEIHRQANRHVGLRLTHPWSYRLGLSDHTAFYYSGVPIMYLFGGRHPGYHTPLDTVDLLEPAKIERIARLAFLTAWEVADREKRITFVERKEQ